MTNKVIEDYQGAQSVSWEEAKVSKKDVYETKSEKKFEKTLVPGVTQAEDNTNKFLALLKNKDGKYSADAAKNGEYDSNGKVISYGDIYNGKAYVGSLLENGAEVLFDLLEISVETDQGEINNTSKLVDIMKYIMYRYTGKSYGVTEANFSDLLGLNNELTASDIVVKSDQGENELVLTKEQILNAAQNYYFGGYKGQIEKIIDDLISIQDNYKVNAVFAIAVTTQECGVGKNCQIGGNNWYSIKGRKRMEAI